MPRFRIREALAPGALLLAWLAFSPAGVHASPSDEPSPSRSPLFTLAVNPTRSAAPPTCAVGPAGQQAREAAAARQQAIAQLVARVRAEIAAGKSDFVPLNGNGYNYPRSRDAWAELEQVQREAAGEAAR